MPPKRKRLAIGQILFCKITDDPVEAKRIAKASTTRFGRMIIDVLRYPEIKDGGYKDMVNFTNKDILDEVLADGKGPFWLPFIAVTGNCLEVYWLLKDTL